MIKNEFMKRPTLYNINRYAPTYYPIRPDSSSLKMYVAMMEEATEESLNDQVILKGVYDLLDTSNEIHRYFSTCLDELTTEQFEVFKAYEAKIDACLVRHLAKLTYPEWYL